MPIEIFDFVNARGSRLSGKIKAPEVMPRGWVLLAHCFPFEGKTETIAGTWRASLRESLRSPIAATVFLHYQCEVARQS